MNAKENINDHYLNSILISPRIAGWGHCSGFDTYWFPEQFIDFILSESARRLYIPQWEADTISLDINNLSQICKQHIVFIDKDKKMYHKTRSIISRIDSSMNWANENEKTFDYSLNRLFEALYHIQLAAEYQIDCDISRPVEIIREINVLKSNSNNREVISFLNDFQGVLNLYKLENVSKNVFKSTDENTIERINELMLDSTFIEISKERRAISLTGNRKVFLKIKNLTRRLAMKKSYKKLISVINLPLLFIPESKRKIVKAIGNLIINKTEFSPSIIDIDKIAMIVIKRISPAPIDMSTGETCVLPWSVYDLPGPPIHKM